MVLKLNRETVSGKIQWVAQQTEPSSLLSGEEIVGLAYKALVRGKNIRIYKIKKPYHFDLEERIEMVDSFRLEFIDDLGRPEWAIPDDAVIADLYYTVTRKASGADQFMSDFLNEE
jgi:hypothetical protein